MKIFWLISNSSSWKVLNQLLQTLSAISIAAITLYLTFFSPFPKLIENELRADLTNAKIELVEIKSKRQNLLDEISVKTKKLSDLKNTMNRLNEERIFYINKIKKESIDQFKKKTDRVISRIEGHIEHAEKFEEYLLWAEYVAINDVKTDFTKFNGKDVSPEWYVNSMNLTINSISRIMGGQSGIVTKKEKLFYLEQRFREFLMKPMQLPTTGERISLPKETGLDLLKYFSRKRILGRLEDKDARVLRKIVDGVMKEHNNTLSQFLDFEMASLNISKNEILKNARSAREKLETFKKIYKNLLVQLYQTNLT